MKKNYVIVDAINCKLLMTKKDYAAASKGYGEAYEALCTMMSAHPTFGVAYKEQKKHIQGEKRSYKGLNTVFMQNYVTALSVEADIKEFQSAQKYAEDNNMNVFSFVKKWFFEKYSNEKNPFDMEKARQVIFEYHLNVIKTPTAPNENKQKETNDNSNVDAAA